MGLDRDADGFYDSTELDSASDPADPTSTPVTVAVQPGPDAAWGVRLLASAPNPVRAAGTMLQFEVATRRSVQLRIYDVAGRHVRTLLHGEVGPGTVRVRWNGTDDGGRIVASGKYFCKLRTGDRVLSHPLLFLH
jgi:hypothetical protein